MSGLGPGCAEEPALRSLDVEWWQPFLKRKALRLAGGHWQRLSSVMVWEAVWAALGRNPTLGSNCELHFAASAAWTRDVSRALIWERCWS